MSQVSSIRITIPNPCKGELHRNRPIRTISDSSSRFTYIHAGAGYGKTTLLSQLAHSCRNAAWLTLAGEDDVFTFINSLSAAIKQVFPDFYFTSLDYFRLSDKEGLSIIIAEAFSNGIEQLEQPVMIVLDDLHTITNHDVRELVSGLLKYAPDNLRLYLGSREALWKELLPLSLRGQIFVLGQDELAFTEEETASLLCLEEPDIYRYTEGWPLAIRSVKILLENGVSTKDIPDKSKDDLCSYLFYECVSHLPKKTVEFLTLSSCFYDLDPAMLDTVLDLRNAKLILENLLEQNLFISKTNDGLYHYHALFKKCLLEALDRKELLLLQQKAADFYLNHKEYHRASEYALHTGNKEILQKILLASYREFLGAGNFSELNIWFQTLGNMPSSDNVRLNVAKGAFLSIIGKFTEANECLDAVIPMLNKDSELYIEAMIHKARAYRNCISFEKSNLLLDEIFLLVQNSASETGYSIIIEKLYNLCWNSQINEAYSLAYQSIEECSRAGNVKIRAWYERYLSAIHFYAGNMKDTIYYYEKSLGLSEEEQKYLDMHGIGIYAAKAYQMLGDNARSLSLLTEELQKLKDTGKFEEMWSGYLLAAEIHYQNSFIDKRNGKDADFELTKKYFMLADEYAPLYRKTDFQMQWAKMQRLTFSLIFTNEPKAKIISQIKLNEVGDYLKCIILSRLMGYFSSISDYPNALKCARHCIITGEKANMLLHSTLSYGVLARAGIITGDTVNADHYTEKYLKLCYELGIYEYFRIRADYDPILNYAYERHIEPEITGFIMEFSGCKTKKAYIKTFGGFAIFPYENRENPIKMRTKKERELFAFLLDSGEQGVTKDQIYEAIWSESESDNIKKLIGVNLSQLKRDLDVLGIKKAIVCHEKHYSINREEIECDYEQYEAAASAYEMNVNREDALKILSLYTGEYLSNFEAFWATGKKLKYRNIYDKALKYCN